MPDNKIFFENEKGQKTISTETTKQELFLPESKKIKLTLPLQKSKNSEILIQTTEGNVYSMYPESTIYIESEKIITAEKQLV